MDEEDLVIMTKVDEDDENWMDSPALAAPAPPPALAPPVVPAAPATPTPPASPAAPAVPAMPEIVSP